MSNALKGIIYGSLTGLFFGFILVQIGNIPEVQMSYSTGECVKVINYTEDTKYSCENMPTKYNHVWVQ